MGLPKHTITARLDGRLDISNALHGHAVLVVSVHVLILQFANLVEEDAELVGDVGNVFVAMLAPQRQLLLDVTLARAAPLRASV